MALSPGKELAKARAVKMREDDRAALGKLREQLKRVRKRRAGALRAAVAKCRKVRLAVRARIEAHRTTVKRKLAEEVIQMRDAARNRCAARKYRIRQAGGSLVLKRRAELAETRRLQRQLQRVDHHAKTQRIKHRASAKERREEDDDHVRGNIPREMLPVFERVRKVIKGNARRTRTEAFLEWAEEHPDDVLAYQQHDTDREVARLIAEHEQVAGRLRKGRAHYKRAAAGEVPF